MSLLKLSSLKVTFHKTFPLHLFVTLERSHMGLTYPSPSLLVPSVLQLSSAQRELKRLELIMRWLTLASAIWRGTQTPQQEILSIS